MKLSLIYLSICTIAVASCLPANAQEGGDNPKATCNRYKFAPNYFPIEQPRLPKGFNHPAPVHHSVTPGAVRGNLLGLDPQMLAPKPQPVHQPQLIVGATPTMVARNVTPTMAPNPGSFSPAFGKPLSNSPMTQPLAALPKQAASSSMPLKPAAAFAPAARRNFNTVVAGRMQRPRHVAPAAAKNEVASYGNGMGYVPGPVLPSAGFGSSTDVRGKIIKKK